jgi:hypothetical protein
VFEIVIVTRWPLTNDDGIAVRARRKLLKRINVIWVVQSYCKNISLHPSGKSSLQIRAIPPHKGRFAIVTDAGWDAVNAAASGVKRDAGRVERPVSHT